MFSAPLCPHLPLFEKHLKNDKKYGIIMIEEKDRRKYVDKKRGESMKKTNRIKTTALVLTLLMLIQLLGSSSIAMISATSADTGVLYETEFNENFSTLESTGIWGVETWQKTDATAPTVTSGIMKFDYKDSVRFNWTEVDDVGGYSPLKRYIFEFDAKITNSGDGSTWGSSNHTRAMYVAFGGWYNQVEMNTTDSRLRTGDTYTSYNHSDFENKTFRYRLVLEGNTITTSIFREDGSLVTSGFRTSADFGNMTVSNGAMTYLVLRCEDGAFELDNFSFEVKGEPKFFEISNTPINVPNGKQAIYTAKIDHVLGEHTIVHLGGAEIFNISDTAMKVCGGQVQGAYGTGEYGIKLYINPTQTMALAEITLPDGGIVRRGSHDRLGGSDISISSTDTDNVSGESVTYESVTTSGYTMTDTEPAITSFGSKVYNLVSSFGNAQTDRLFAWTAKASYIGSGTMALKYREKGQNTWTKVDAVKSTEPTEVADEDYFKVEISGLRADTEYEYKIGKVGGSSTTDWSEIYSFTTAREDIKEFSFIAIGDTQGGSWGTYKYTRSALDEAIKQTPNPAFILHTGDVVSTGYELSQWNLFFKSLGNYSTKIATFAAIGNHDTINNNTKNNYFDFHFNHPGASDTLDVAPSVASGLSSAAQAQINHFSETVYSYNYGDAHFVVINSGTYSFYEDKAILEGQRDWLRRDLEANKDARWKIFMMHEVVYHRLGGDQNRPYLADIIEDYGVDLVLQGHSHLVTRTYPMKNGQIVTKTSPDVVKKGSGTVYMTIGSTTTSHDTMGASNVEACQTIITPTSAQAAYTTVTVKENELVLTIKQLDGLVLDTFTIVDSTDDNETNIPNTDMPDTNTPGTDEPSTEASTLGEPSTESPAEQNKGCGGSVSLAGLALVAALGACTTFVGKKKDN